MTRLKQYTIWRDPEDHLNRIHKNVEEHHYIIELLVLVKVRDCLDAGSFEKSCPVIGLMCSPYNREHCIQTSSLSARVISRKLSFILKKTCVEPLIRVLAGICTVSKDEP
jgi:hypothetical protein